MGLTTRIAGLRECLRFSNRWSLILLRLIFRAERLQIYRLGNLEFLVDHSAGDAAGTRSVLLAQMYRELLPETGLSAGQPLRVLDLGANGGGFSLLLANEGFSLEKLVAVELNPKTAIRLRFNIDRNIAGEHEVIVAALTGNGRSVDVSLGEGGTGDSIYTGSAHGIPRHIPGISFDGAASRLGPGRIHLVKMDVEGAEAEVIMGALATRLADVDAFIVEIHDAANVRALADRLSTYGLAPVTPLCTEPGVFLFKREISQRPVASNDGLGTREALQ